MYAIIVMNFNVGRIQNGTKYLQFAAVVK